MKRRAFLTESGALIGASLMSGSQALGEIPLREEVGSDERTESSYSGRSGTTPLTLEDIHNRMESICLDHAGNGQVGAFFSVVWLISNLASQLKSAEFYMQRLSYPTPFDQISAGLEIDASTITLAINSGRIELSGFAPAIVYREPAPKTGTYSKTTIQFKPVRLRLNQDPAEPGKLRFYIWTADPKDPYYPKFSTQPGTVNTALLQQNGVSQADYDMAQAAIRVSAAPMDILTSFIASLPILGIVEAMRQFGIADPMEFEFTDDLVIVHGPSNTTAASPCGAGAGTKVDSIISPRGLNPAPGADGGNSFALAFHHAVTAVDKFTETKYPPFGYYYPIDWSFKDFGIGVVSPGVVASDRGDFAMFHWEYHASARPKPNGIQIQIKNDPTTNQPQLQITMDCPFDVGGAAGVSMKVGCVTVPLLSTAILGHIENPSVFVLKFALANTANGPGVIVTASYDCNVDVAFYNPPMVDVLLNVLLGSFGNKLIAGELRRLVNSLNFQLIDLSALGYITGEQAGPWRLGQSFHRNSVLIGLEQGRKR